MIRGVVFFLLAAAAPTAARRPHGVRVPAPRSARASTANCTERWYDGIYSDHFSWAAPGGGRLDATFAVRVFEHDAAWGGQ